MLRRNGDPGPPVPRVGAVLLERSNGVHPVFGARRAERGDLRVGGLLFLQKDNVLLRDLEEPRGCRPRRGVGGKESPISPLPSRRPGTAWLGRLLAWVRDTTGGRMASYPSPWVCLAEVPRAGQLCG